MRTRFTPSRLIVASVLALVLPATLPGQQGSRAPVTNAATAAQDSVLARLERAQWEALKTRDTTTFARLMGNDVVDIDVSGIKRTSASSVTRYVLGCRTASYALSEMRIAHYGATAIVTYKNVIDASCWGQKAPSPLNVMTAYQQRGDDWRAIAHSETPAARWEQAKPN